MKKVIITVFVTVLSIVIILLGGFGLNHYIKNHKSLEMTDRIKTKYNTNEEGTRIIDIPFEDYISKDKKPSNTVVPNISENGKGEKNSKAINDAVNSLTSGGVVYIPKGEYKVSTITLKSNVTLFVSEGAKLVSLNCEENEKSDNPLSSSVVYADKAENIRITGGGTICGSGESYTKPAEKSSPLYALKKFNLYVRVMESRKRIRFSKDTVRNNIILLNECENVKIDNIVLEESATWTLVIKNCENVSVKNVVIDNNMHVANTDGIDVCGGSKIQISHCFIATGDDAIVLKSNEGEISNVTVKDCILSSFANCFKIGTETPCDVSDVSVSDCKFFMPNGITGGYAGIAIESADGANISNVKVDNIEMDGVSSPILIWLGNRLKYGKDEVGSIKNVFISNVNAVNTELPSAITGCKHDGEIYNVENVTLSNISATYRDTLEDLRIRKNVSDISMNGYPEITRVSHYYFLSHEFSEYWDLPCYSLFVRYAENIDYSGYKTIPRTCFELDEFYVEDVT